MMQNSAQSRSTFKHSQAQCLYCCDLLTVNYRHKSPSTLRNGTINYSDLISGQWFMKVTVRCWSHRAGKGGREVCSRSQTSANGKKQEVISSQLLYGTLHYNIPQPEIRKEQRHFRRKSWVLRSIGWLFEIVGTGSVGWMATLLHRKIIYDRIHPQPQDDGYYIAEFTQNIDRKWRTKIFAFLLLSSISISIKM